MIGLAVAALVLSLLEVAGVVLGVIAFVKVTRLQKELDTLREKLRAKFRQQTSQQPTTEE